jgi:hypothetical protein
MHHLYPRMGIGVISAAWHQLLNRMFDPYRPECHYMRGPGPKWRAKHQAQSLSW